MCRACWILFFPLGHLIQHSITLLLRQIALTNPDRVLWVIGLTNDSHAMLKPNGHVATNHCDNHVG